jgi:hypothetical protein
LLTPLTVNGVQLARRKSGQPTLSASATQRSCDLRRVAAAGLRKSAPGTTTLMSSKRVLASTTTRPHPDDTRHKELLFMAQNLRLQYRGSSVT